MNTRKEEIALNEKITPKEEEIKLEQSVTKTITDILGNKNELSEKVENKFRSDKEDKKEVE